VTHPTTNPLTTLPTQRSFSASDQINALLANDPSISLDLFLFESKLYWDSLPQESLIGPTFSSANVDSFLHSFNAIEHFNNIKSHLPSSRYRSISSSTLQFQRILLEARGLQTSIRGEVWVDAARYRKYITGTDRRSVRGQTVLSLSHAFNARYAVKHPFSAPILALCRPINFTNPLIWVPSF
jgi:hypothetical protein